MPLLCSSQSETPQKPSPSGTCAGFGWRGGCLGCRYGSCQVAEKHSYCAAPPESSVPAEKKKKNPNKNQRALMHHWRCNLLWYLFPKFQLYLLSDKEGKYGPVSTLFLKCCISKCTDYESEQQKRTNATQILAEWTQSLLLYVLDSMKERTLGQRIKANNNY